VRITMLPGTSVPTSALGVGMGGLFRLPQQADRFRILAAAHDAGIVHIDTAPMYGLGAAEAELGRFARGRRDQLVIATKFGITPTLVARTLSGVQGSLRRVLASSSVLQREAHSRAAGPRSGTAGALLYSAAGYDALTARRSLHASLRAIRTDHIDLFLLHEPHPGDVRTADICAFLEQVRSAGLVRAWGVAGEPSSAGPVAAQLGPRAVLQVRNDVFSRLTYPSLHRAPRIGFGVLGRALPRLRALFGPTCSRLAILSEDQLASLLLREALRSNPDGVLLIGTTDIRHLHQAVEAAEVDPMGPDLEAEALARTVAAACGGEPADSQEGG
jgi:D-threo-aldose 1-dehydrogenase